MCTAVTCNRLVLLVAVGLVVRTDGRMFENWPKWDEPDDNGRFNDDANYENSRDNDFRDNDQADVGNDYNVQTVDNGQLMEVPSVSPGMRLFKKRGNLYEYGPDSARQLPSIFDPTSFTAVILRCHETCGDTYYNCSFFECPSEETNETKRKDPTWGSKLLKFLSLGLIKSDVDVFRESACLNSCKQAFRVCYTSCICDLNFNFAKYFCN